ncbi:MAG: protein phosphatase 2C domain-containing protein [Propionibacteriaceae bacterium]|nr:protein phosphatase 2C domain-containing protein [Propionibacteriaceae bacterium]
MVSVACGSRSDIGHVREHNEDNLVIGRRLWAVADGMGGHAAGDVASALVIAGLRTLDAHDELRAADVVAALQEVNRAILAHGEEHPEARGLGSTVTGLAAVTIGGVPHAAVFNVGDSRVYRWAGGVLSRATVDHSEAEELVLEGVITADQARTHRSRNIVTRSLGQPHPMQVDLWVLPLTAGERFVLCSDGLSGELTDEAIADLVRANPDPQAAADALVEAALAAGGRDNVTVVMVDLDDAGADQTEAPA